MVIQSIHNHIFLIKWLFWSKSMLKYTACDKISYDDDVNLWRAMCHNKHGIYNYIYINTIQAHNYEAAYRYRVGIEI